MPYPSQVDRESIIAQAWQLIEDEGVDNLSLSKLAASLNVKAPSLYRHVANKASLLQAVNLHTSQQLVATIHETASRSEGSAIEQLTKLMHSYRHFAHAHPHSYMLAFTNTNDAQRPDEETLAQLAIPLQQLMTAVSGSEHSLAALRGAMALVHGFVLLELHGQLRRGGDLEQDFDTAVWAYLQGWQKGEST